MHVVAVIPARIGSTRLPNKVLADIGGRPMIWHVWNRVCQARRITAVYVATDSEFVKSIVEEWGGQALMTSVECRSGTERIAEASAQFDADLVLNVQGDEPLISPELLDALVQRWEDTKAELITPVYRISSLDDLSSSNIVKVARTAQGEALYFSRSPIPFVRDRAPAEWLEHHQFWGHVGVYGYRPDILAHYPALPVSPLEQSEQLEQLRFLEAGYRFQTVETGYRPIAVDVAADLERVKTLVKEGA